MSDVHIDLGVIKENCELLVVGWFESVEYKVPVTYHDRDKCSHRARSVQGTCNCPVEHEVRKRDIKRPGLLQQLEEFKKYQDTDREPKAERQAPRVKKIKNNAELSGFFALDEIACDASAVIDRAWAEAEISRTWASVKTLTLLGLLPGQSANLVSRPDLVWTIRRATDKWVAQARRVLRLTVSDAMFGDTVCGNCGGGLGVPVDASGAVRCIGSPTAAPCGDEYPMSEWVALYERMKRS